MINIFFLNFNLIQKIIENYLWLLLYYIFSHHAAGDHVSDGVS
jgi:hypothetical protein